MIFWTTTQHVPFASSKPAPCWVLRWMGPQFSLAKKVASSSNIFPLSTIRPEPLIRVFWWIWIVAVGGTRGSRLFLPAGTHRQPLLDAIFRSLTRNGNCRSFPTTQGCVECCAVVFSKTVRNNFRFQGLHSRSGYTTPPTCAKNGQHNAQHVQKRPTPHCPETTNLTRLKTTRAPSFLLILGSKTSCGNPLTECCDGQRVEFQKGSPDFLESTLRSPPGVPETPKVPLASHQPHSPEAHTNKHLLLHTHHTHLKVMPPQHHLANSPSASSSNLTQLLDFSSVIGPHTADDESKTRDRTEVRVHLHQARVSVHPGP